MKQVTTFISTYTADVSAVCSALYEMGGMVVIHDPSGCNSTYNTHDEPRWYDQESLIYISGLSEIDAIMGNDEKFIDDIVTAAKTLCPKFIVVLQTPIPYMTGTDFTMIIEEVERRTDIATYYIPTTGMQSYLWGINEGQKLIAKHFVEDPLPQKEESFLPKINILGVTPLDFSVNDSVTTMISALEESGVEIISCFSMGEKTENIRNAAQAQVNLVVSSGGYEAAKYMEKKYHIPYLVMMPTWHNIQEVYQHIQQICLCGKSHIERKNELGSQEIILVGEAVICQSLAEIIRLEKGVLPTILCPQETDETLRSANMVCATAEEDIAKVLGKAETVLADPMFLPVCDPEVNFISLPQECCSGRIYRKQIPNLYSFQLNS